jgi:small subunit ribosomal protein S24e
MEVKILEKKKNEVMKRTEITAEMHEKTIPSKQQVRDKLSALLNVKPETIAITKINSKFGSAKAEIFATAYETAEELKKREPVHIMERNFGKEKKAEAEGPEAPPANFKK